jgi:hypothetical protein
MCRSLGLDPRMIRFSVMKLAERLGTRGQIKGVEDVEGKVDWMTEESWSETAVASMMNKHGIRGGAPHLDDEEVD